MIHKNSIQKYRYWYSKLLRCYSKPYYKRFGEGMEQTFSDLLHERAGEQKGLFSYALWMFFETSKGIFKENITNIIMKNKRILIVVIVTIAILMIPLIAMQISDEWDWSVGDFIFMGILIGGMGLAFEFATRKGNISYKFAIGIAVGTAFLLTWSNLAVGFIGDDNPANLLYLVLVAALFISAAISGLKPQKMTRILFAVAIAQLLIPVIALIFSSSDFQPGVLGVFAITAFFTMLWITSGVLFLRASSQELEVKPSA